MFEGKRRPKTATPTVADAALIAGKGILIGIGLVPTTVIVPNEGGGGGGGGGGGLVACTTISSICAVTVISGSDGAGEQGESYTCLMHCSPDSPLGSVPSSGSLPT
jgi:hypothetical protein